MQRNVYEAMFLLDSNRYSNDPSAVTNRLQDLIERHGGELLASRPWDERRLAYQIRGQRKGLYYLTYFRMEGPEVSQLERDCRMYEPILRHLILKVEHQLVDQLLAQASVSQGNAEQQSEQPESAGAEKGDSSGDGQSSSDQGEGESKGEGEST